MRRAAQMAGCILLICILLISQTAGCSALAVDIEGAFSDCEGDTAREYMKKYGWDEAQFLVRSWQADLNGTTVSFERTAGYQREFLKDHMLTTRKYLGLSETGRENQALNAQGASAFVALARKEAAAEDNREVPPDSNCVKYNTWFYGKEVSGPEYDWNCVFVSWCADACGLTASGLFKKTRSSADLYKHMINENGFAAYPVKQTTPMGGREYTPEPGDLMFFFEDAAGTSCCRVGIVVQVTAGKLYVVEGDCSGRTEQRSYDAASPDPTVQNGQIIHVQYPLTFADGGSTEANAPIIFQFLTEYMHLSPAAACGAMGNMVRESRLIPDQTEYGYTWASGAGYGLIQWTNVSGNHRVGGLDSAYLIQPGQTSFRWIQGHNRTNLVNWCTAHGYDYHTLSGQLFFLKYQLTESPDRAYYAPAIRRLSQQPNTLGGVQASSDIWLQRVEGLPPSNRYWRTQSPLRKQSAVQFWSQFGQGGGKIS